MKKDDNEEKNRQDQEFKEFSPFEKYRTIAGCIMINLVIGTVYVWGGVSPYVCSFLKARDQSVTQHSVSKIFPLMQLLIKLSSVVGVKLCMEFSTRSLTYVTTLVMLVSILMVSFQIDLAGYLVLYMMFFGICSGILYLVPLKIVWEIFPQRKGLVSGLVLAGYGFASFIFKFVALVVVNPDNLQATLVMEEQGETVKYFTEEVYRNVPLLFRILFVCYSSIMVVALLLIKFPAENRTQASGNLLQAETECPTIKKGVTTYAFWSMFFLALTMIFFGQFFINNYKFYGKINPALKDDAYLTVIGSLAAASNGVSRIFWAILYDKYGFKRIFLCAATIQVILSLTITFTTESRVLYGIWLCLSMWCMGCYFATFGPWTYTIFGKKLGAQFYGYVLYGVVFGNIVAIGIRQARMELAYCFWLAFVFSLLGIFLAYFQKDKYNWAEKSPEIETSLNENGVIGKERGRTDSLQSIKELDSSLDLKNEGKNAKEKVQPKPSYFKFWD